MVRYPPVSDPSPFILSVVCIVITNQRHRHCEVTNDIVIRGRVNEKKRHFIQSLVFGLGTNQSDILRRIPTANMRSCIQ